MRFHGVQGPEVRGLCHRDDAPKETFTWFQLAAFSSIFMDFPGFHEISWISCIFMDIYVFLRISRDFIRFHGFQGPEVRGLCHRDDVLKETFTRFQLAAFS